MLHVHVPHLVSHDAGKLRFAPGGVSVPTLMNICPPGSAKALICLSGMTWNSNGHEYLRGIVDTSFLPTCRMYWDSTL
jgi:hypothetical protein